MVDTTFTRAVLAHPQEARPLCFVELMHDSLPDSIRIVNDATALDPATQTHVPYNYSGKVWNAFPFELALFTDNARVPQAKIRAPNVDRAIGNALLRITDAINVRLTLLSSADFAINGGGTAMVPSGTPTIQKQVLFSSLRNTVWDRIMVEGELRGVDISREPAPYHRATIERAPCLHM